MRTVRPAPEGALTEADSWPAQSHPPNYWADTIYGWRRDSTIL